ncbi:MAG TPA: hypothetical protein PKZ84_19390 [Anaerolineae bacterium]|nr:hypothetical protein [Anaerolineae bacterium]HQI86788.1 hypothetical protein [Anaerolineae bacterium]
MQILRGALSRLRPDLALPRVLYEDNTRREYMTRVIVLMLGIVSSVVTVLLAVGYVFDWFMGEDVVIILVVSLLMWAGWWLANRGVWRIGRYAPIGLFFALAVYVNYLNFAQSNGDMLMSKQG